MASKWRDDPMDDESCPLLVNDDVDVSSVLEDDLVESRKCLKNAVVHCACVMAVFTSFVSVDNLDQYPGEKSDLEMLSRWCLYAGTLSVCLLSPVIIHYVGYKWTMVASFGGQCIYAVVRYYPRAYTFVPAGILFGLTLGPFWTAQSMFLTTVAITYGQHADVDADVAVSRFYGMFYAFQRSARIWASLISSEIVASPEDVIWNVSYPVNETCGASFCSLPMTSAAPLVKAPKQSQVSILLAVYVTLSLSAIIVKAVCVDDVKPLPTDDGQLPTTLAETLTSTIRIHCNACFGFLIPVMFYNGVEQVMLLDHFTQAFVTCELGVGYIGYVMITFAAVSAVSAFLMGQMERCCGRMLLFLAAAIFNLAMIILMLKWKPGEGTKDDWLLYFIPGLWALSDSIWQTTLVSMIAVDFKYNREGAFAAFRFWQALGVLCAVIYGVYVCMRTKLYIVLSLLCLSMPLYLIMEFYMKHQLNRPYIDLYAPIT